VPVVVVRVFSVTLPSLSVVRWLDVSMVAADDGAGIGCVVCVDVVVEDEICACAEPIVIVIAAAAASQVLIMGKSPGYVTR
jgi:hypothetical protein